MTDKPAISAFERKRLENIAANQAMLRDLSTTAQKLQPKPTPAPKPKPTSTARRRNRAPAVRETAVGTRTSSRIKGIEADSETHKRKAEAETAAARELGRVKRHRVSGDLELSSVMEQKGSWKRDTDFLGDVMRGARPYERTFDETDVRETTDKGLRELRERMSGLKLFGDWEPARKSSRSRQARTDTSRDQDHARTGVFHRIPSHGRQATRLCGRQAR
jgi:hypothetical protein